MKKKVHPVFWDRHAYHDLKQLLAYVSKKSEQAPNIVKQGITKCIDVIKTNPYAFEKDELKNNNDDRK